MSIKVKKLVKDLNLELVAGQDGKDNTIADQNVERPGLEFAGFYDFFQAGRPDTTTHIYSDHLIYGQINIDLATLNSKINTLIEENNLEVESIILSVNALDANSQYSTSITLSYSLNI